MSERIPLDPAEVADAVRALLRKETERVDDPHRIPEDRAGWHAMRPVADDAVGFPYYEPESWRWFDLVDVGLADEMVLLVFRWTDPATPDLRYSVHLHADGLPTADAAAFVIRGQLRRLLEPGWRDRVGKRWLSRDQVLVWRERQAMAAPQEVRDRLDRHEQRRMDDRWSRSR